jgi:hypothetical protein
MSLRSITFTIAVVAGTFLFSGLTALAAVPNPSFPVGRINVESIVAIPGTRPLIDWSVSLPADANAGDYSFFIRQEQLQEHLTFDVSVAQEGGSLSPLAPGVAGSKFELWAVRGSSFAAYLLDATVFSPYLPKAFVTIRSEDPYSLLPRTRADRPFYVEVAVDGIVNMPEVPGGLKGVKFFHHAQSYGADGTGAQVDRDQATLVSESTISTNGEQTLTFAVSDIPAAGHGKARGEERFSLVSLADYRMPEPLTLSTRSIQIWPVAGGSISGIAPGQTVGSAVPEVTIQLNDLYPSSTTFAQVYPGNPQSGVTGTILPGSTITVDDSVPANRSLLLGNYGSVFDSDGLWTLEILTLTPFGTDRIAHVSFQVEGVVTTIESWRQTHFGNGAEGEDLVDFEKDGIPNLVEYAFGFDPTANSAGLLPAPQLSENHLVIRFNQPAGVGGIVYGAEWSTTLLPDSWVPVPDSGGLPEHVFSVPVAGKPRLYMRLKVTRE